MNKNNSSKITAAVLLILLFGLVIFLEQVIRPTDEWAMLLSCLRMGSVYALVAVSMNLLNGFTGLFSLGQAGFMLIGAYTYAIFSIPLDLKDSVYTFYDYSVKISFPEVLGNVFGGFGMITGVLVSIILAGIITAMAAFLIGLPVLRLRSDYLAIATLGFAEIIRAVFLWGRLGPVTNGSNPLRRFTRTSDFTMDVGNTTLTLGTTTIMIIAAACIFVIILLVNSSYGRVFKAIREDEIAAEAMGINLYKHKQLSFCISSFFTGVGGALLAIFMGTVMASNFMAAMTYEFLLIIVLGGIGSISGSVVGAMLFVFASQWWLRWLDSGIITLFGTRYILPNTIFRSGFRLVVFSVIIMCVVLFFRRGLMGDKELPYYWNKLKSRIMARKPKAGESNG
ncbi:MAG: branched-chain amino acid ABC transporter permease [Defluviitaleaceae bacterium]|nr:branched-chain amino acid ABC transporter permease [Defluviitaleaceae bacterium]MCL2836379.1 branched-chain amino acid ABC transporter permease [Defluviitaleaceae bacterium]